MLDALLIAEYLEKLTQEEYTPLVGIHNVELYPQNHSYDINNIQPASPAPTSQPPTCKIPQINQNRETRQSSTASTTDRRYSPYRMNDRFNRQQNQATQQQPNRDNRRQNDYSTNDRRFTSPNASLTSNDRENIRRQQ